MNTICLHTPLKTPSKIGYENLHSVTPNLHNTVRYLEKCLENYLFIVCDTITWEILSCQQNEMHNPRSCNFHDFASPHGMCAPRFEFGACICVCVCARGVILYILCHHCGSRQSVRRTEDPRLAWPWVHPLAKHNIRATMRSSDPRLAYGSPTPSTHELQMPSSCSLKTWHDLHEYTKGSRTRGLHG